MANVHVMSTDGTDLIVVMHFAIPATNNTAGVSWRTAAARHFGTTRLPDGDGDAGTISAAEKTSIQSGAVVEVSTFIKLGNANPTNAQLDAEHAAQQTRFVADFQARFARYGYTR